MSALRHKKMKFYEIPHILPDEICQLVYSHCQVAMLATVSKVQPCGEEDQEDEHDKVSKIGQRLQTYHTQCSRHHIKDDDHCEQHSWSSSCTEQILAVIVPGLHEKIKFLDHSFLVMWDFCQSS